MKKTRGAIVAIFVLVVGAMFVVACGGDDDAKTSVTATNQPQSSSTAAATTDAGDATSAATVAATTAPVNATEPPSGGDVASDACALLTTAEVEDAFGEPTQEPVPDAAIDVPISGGVTASVSTCGYTSESFTSSLSVTYYSAPGKDDAIAGMIQLACQGHETISGLGDAACWYDEQHVQIQMAKDGSFVDVFATTSLDAGEMLMNVMEKAAGRI